MKTALSNSGAYAATLRRRALRPALLVALVAAALGAAAAPDATLAGQPRIQALRATSDAFVSATRMSRNYGNARELHVDASPTARAYLRFDDVKAAAVEHVSLMLYSRTKSRAGYQVRLADDRWLERRITLLNAPSLSEAFVRSGPLKAGAWNAVDVTALTEELGGSIDTLSLALTTKTSKGVDLASRETGLHGPRLVVERGASVEPPPPPAPQPEPTPAPTPISPPTGTPESLPQ